MIKSISSPSSLPNGWGWSWNFHPSNHGCFFLVGSAPSEARLGPPVNSHYQHAKDTLGTQEILRVWGVVCRNQEQRPNIYYLSHHSRWGWLCPRERPRVVVLGGLCCLWANRYDLLPAGAASRASAASTPSTGTALHIPAFYQWQWCKQFLGPCRLILKVLVVFRKASTPLHLCLFRPTAVLQQE